MKNTTSLPKKQNKVLCIHSGKREESGACEIYRVTTPLYYLNRQKGWLADWISFSQFYEVFHLKSAEKALLELIDSYDVFVWARTYLRDSEEAFESAAYIINLMRARGRKVIYETDDDTTNVHRRVIDGDSVTFASWADAITVTTPYLAERMKEATKRPVHVLPNMLDPLLWRTESKVKLDRDKIRIALTGSKTHSVDWLPLKGVLQRIGRDYPNVRILLGTLHPEYLQDIPNVELVPPLPYQMYVDLVKNSDIILAPVDPDDEFNNGKSPIKALEGMGAARRVNGEFGGAAVIATDNKVYNLTITDDVNGLLVDHTSEAWESAIRKVLDDEGLRHRLQKEAFKTAWRKFNLSTNWPLWAKAYQHVLKEPSSKVIIDYAKSYSNYRKSVSRANGN